MEAALARTSPTPERSRTRFPISTLIGAGLAVLCSLGVVLAFRAPPVTDMVRRMQGYVIVVDNPSTDVVVSGPGAKVAVAFPIRNVSGETVTVFDADLCCGDKVATQLPLLIPAGAELEIVFNLTGPSKNEGAVRRTIQLFVDARSPAIVLQVNLTVVATAPQRVLP